MVRTLIACLNWNDSYRTIRCLNSLLKVNSKNTSILLVDNNSNKQAFKKVLRFIKKNTSSFKKVDYSIFYKKKINQIKFKKFYLLKIPFNSGCTGGFNFAYKFAIINKFDFVSRIDNDCTVDKNYLKKKIKFLNNNPDVVGINSKVCYLQKKDKVQWVGAYDKKKIFLFQSLRPFKKTKKINDVPDYLNKNKWNGYKKTDFLNGPGSLIRVSAIKKAGLANIQFFFGPEDIEFSNRLKNFGKLMLCLDSTIFHEVAQSQNITGLDKRRYFEMKSSLLLIKLIGNFKDKLFSYNLYVMRTLFYLISSILVRKNFMQFYISVIAMKDFLFGKLGIYDLKIINSNIKKKLLLDYIDKFKYD